jgi:hypothetical protein
MAALPGDLQGLETSLFPLHLDILFPIDSAQGNVSSPSGGMRWSLTGKSQINETLYDRELSLDTCPDDTWADPHFYHLINVNLSI